MDRDLQAKVLRMIARHDAFLRRAARMLAADERGDTLPSDAEYHMDELKSLDSSASDLAVELLGSPPSNADWTPPIAFAYQGYGSKNDHPMWWLKQFQRGLILSKRYFESFLVSSSADVHLGDKIAVGNAHVVMTSGASARDISIQGPVVQENADLDLKAIADELALLRKALRSHNPNDDAQKDTEIGAIASAEQAARAGDHNKMLTHLKSAGSWAIETATNIGVEVAAAALKSAVGIAS